MARVVASAESQHKPDELDLGQPELRPEECLRHEVLGQALHEAGARSRRAARSSATGSGPFAAGEDLRGVGREQRDDVDEEPLGVVETELAVNGRLERQAPDRECTATSASSRSSSQRGRGRIGPSSPAAAAVGSPHAAPWHSSRECPLQPHPDLADLELVPEAHRRDAVDPPPVDVRAVGGLPRSSRYQLRPR
jgi:hypothetical protein